MGKQKKKKNVYRDDYYDEKPSYASDGRRGQNKSKGGSPAPHGDRPYTPARNKPEFSPVAKLLRNVLVDQIDDFHEAIKSGVDLQTAANNLLVLPSYPAAIMDADEYEFYQLERVVQIAKSNPNMLFNPTVTILGVHRETRAPAFLAKVFMKSMPDGTYQSRITIYEQDGSGTNYDKVLRWSSDHDKR